MAVQRLSLGQQILRNGRRSTSTAASLPAGPATPLYFLYPRWFQTATETTESREAVKVNPRRVQGAIPNTSGEVIGTEASERPGVVRRVGGAFYKQAARKAYNSRTREMFHERQRTERNAPPPDWRAILLDLDRLTPDQSVWHEKALKLSIPAAAANQLLRGLDDNGWIIKEESGCHMELSPRESSQSDTRTLLLSGSAMSIAKAATRILAMIPNARKERSTIHLQPFSFTTKSPNILAGNLIGDQPKVRAVLTHFLPQSTSPRRADRITRPTTWTTASFASYVYQLTHMEMSPHLHKFLYEPRERHSIIVADILQAIFSAPECRAALSATALNEAIAYLIGVSKLKHVRDIFVHAESAGLTMTTETFDKMLRGAAKAGNLSNFHFILGLMRSRGHAPSGRTWVAFLAAVGPLEIKLLVLEAMKRKGLLQDVAVQRRVCSELVDYEIESALRDDLSQTEFFEKMTALYGHAWLSVSAANKILNVLGGRGFISACWEVLDYMEAKGVPADSITINTLLTHFRHQGDLDAMKELIRRLSVSNSFPHNEVTHEILFTLAWKHRLFTVARTVWRYACLEAATTFSMRKRVGNGLSAALSTAKTDMPKWKLAVCAFIVDAPPTVFPLGLSSYLTSRLPPHSTLTRVAPDRNSTLRPNNVTPVAEIGSQTLAAKIAKEAVRSDLELFEHFVPKKSFAAVLLQSLELDTEFKALMMKEKADALASSDPDGALAASWAVALNWLYERRPEIELVPQELPRAQLRRVRSLAVQRFQVGGLSEQARKGQVRKGRSLPVPTRTHEAGAKEVQGTGETRRWPRLWDGHGVVRWGKDDRRP